jgi:hypothetical protein
MAATFRRNKLYFASNSTHFHPDRGSTHLFREGRSPGPAIVRDQPANWAAFDARHTARPGQVPQRQPSVAPGLTLSIAWPTMTLRRACDPARLPLYPRETGAEIGVRWRVVGTVPEGNGANGDERQALSTFICNLVGYAR